MAKLLETFVLPLINPLCGLLPRSRPENAVLRNAHLVAHRGAWLETGEAENTLAAFAKAIELGVWAVEFDVRWTKDVVPVVHHDRSLKRVFGHTELIEALSFAQLRAREPRVPSLQETLDMCRGKIHLFLEIKDTLTEQQLKILKSQMRELRPGQDFHLMGFERSCLLSLQQEFPSQSLVGIARTNVTEILSACREHGWGGFTAQYLMVNQEHIQSCLDYGIAVGTGFPDRASLLYREVNRKVPWIFTNYPKRLKQIADS